MSQYNRITVHRIDLERIDNLDLDFDKIEGACGLSFNSELQFDLKCAVLEYQDAKVAHENIPATEVKKYLDKILGAIDILTPVLAIASTGPDPKANDKSVLQAVWKHSRPYKSHHPKEHVIKRYLDDWRELAIESKALGGRPGQPRDIPLRTFIAYYAHPIFLGAGGTGIGCAANISAKNHYSGQFYDLVCEVLRQVDGHVMAPSGVGKVICEILRGKS